VVGTLTEEKQRESSQLPAFHIGLLCTARRAVSPHWRPEKPTADSEPMTLVLRRFSHRDDWVAPRYKKHAHVALEMVQSHRFPSAP
jgi:hypothetical protein